MPYGNINVDTVTTGTAGGILGAGNASIMKNRIINGAMVIDQRNAGASVATTTLASGDIYCLDRWALQGSQNSKFTAQQNAGSVTPPAGFTNYIGITSSSTYSISAGDYFDFYQYIEGFNAADLGFGTANAKTITLSFWARSSLTGTFGGVVSNNNYSRCYPYSYTINSANTWEYKTVTIAGDTSGTWLTTNGRGMQVSFGIACGSTYAGAAGSWSGTQYLGVVGQTSVVGTNGATFYITGVQLEVGSSATGFEYRQYGQELALCQRYYEKSYNVDVVPATSTGDGKTYIAILYSGSTILDNGTSIKFSVAKRANPSIAYWRETGTSNVWDYSNVVTTGTLTPLSNRVGTTLFNIYASGSGFTATTYIASGHWTASAEL